MSTYGDRYVFAFETTGASKAARDMASVAKNANEAAIALNTLAAAWRNYSMVSRSAIAMSGALPKATLRNVQVVNNPSGGVVNAPFSDLSSYNRTTTTNRAPSGTAATAASQRNPSSLPFGQTGLSRYAIFWAEGFAINAAIQTITNALNDWSMVQQDMNTQSAQFAVSLRGTRVEIERYQDAVLDLSRMTGIPFAELGPGLITQMRVKGAPADLALRSAQVQRVTGVDNLSAERDLLALSKQFPDKTTVQILDAFSAAMRRSSLQADEFFGMLESAGPLSKQFNTSMETIFGIFAGVSTVAGESGSSIELFLRQMERVYTEAETRSVVEKYTGPVSFIDERTGDEIRRPIDEIFADLARSGSQAIQEVAVTIPNMLGQQTRQLFLSMMSEWETSITDAISGAKNATGEWNENVRLMSDTWQAEIQEMQSAWQRFLLTVGNSEFVRTATRTATEVLDYAALRGQADQLEAQYVKSGATRFKTADPFGTGNRMILGLPEAFRAETGMEAFPTLQSKLMNKPVPEFLDWKITALLNDMQKDNEFRKSYAAMPTQYQRRVDAYNVPFGGETFRGNPAAVPGRFGLVPATSPGQQLTLPTGMTAEMLKKMTDRMTADAISAYRNAPTYDLKGQVSYPNQNMTDQAIMKKLGLDTMMAVETFDNLDRALGNVSVVAAMVDPAMKQFSETLKETGKAVETVNLKTTKSEWGRVSPGKFGVDSTLGEKANAEYQRLRENLIFQAKEMSGAWEMTDQQALESVGVHEQLTVAMDTQNNALMKATIDSNLFAIALGNVSASAQGIIQLQYFTPPDWMSEKDYAARLQAASTRNLKIQRLQGGGYSEDPNISRYISPSGSAFDISGNTESRAQAFSEVGREIARIESNTAKQKQLAEEANSKLEQIRESVRGFVGSLLQPTPVTGVQLAEAKLGQYKDQWDEPVRRVRDVVARREAMNPKLGPWEDFAKGVGVDTSSIESTVVTGAEFERKFYGGLMGPEFYNQYSKEGFLAQAQSKMAEMQGRKGLEEQAMGWLKEAGLDTSLSEYFAKEFAGTISPAEIFIRGGKDNAALISDTEDIGTASATGIVAGMASQVKDQSPVTEIINAFDIKSDDTKVAIEGLGKSIGTYLITGMGEAIKDGLIGEIYARVMASISLEE